MKPIQLVWLKRDLRISDHTPLLRASEQGPVVVLYLYEPTLLQRPEYDASHVTFINDCLADVASQLEARGGRLTYRTGRMRDVLDELQQTLAPHGGIANIWSHQEVGMRWTYSRDLAVARWCRDHGVRWLEETQDGVWRGRTSRDGWAQRWHARMTRPLQPAPTSIQDVSTQVPSWDHGQPQSPESLGLRPSTARALQRGGETAAHEVLQTFLRERVTSYPGTISSPVLAPEGCSRLSPHLAWGSISTKRVYQQAQRAMETAKRRRNTAAARGLRAFTERLAWRDHFMQKLEDQTSLTWRNLSPATEALQRTPDATRFEAWRTGHTGYPMVDACMRYLEANRWLNFRMRAMVVSFASYHLWLPWQQTATHLASRFLDFEPGIHFPQIQMQSGTTGINQLRIYDPTKQARDQDPDGEFIRTWVPELRALPCPWIFEPATTPPLLAMSLGFQLGVDYPAPIVPHLASVRRARRAIEQIRQTPQGRREAREVFERHGSRRKRMRR